MTEEQLREIRQRREYAQALRPNCDVYRNAAYAADDIGALLSEVDRLRRLLRQAYEVVVWQARTDVELRPLADAIRAVGVGDA